MLARKSVFGERIITDMKRSGIEVISDELTQMNIWQMLFTKGNYNQENKREKEVLV